MNSLYENGNVLIHKDRQYNYQFLPFNNAHSYHLPKNTLSYDDCVEMNSANIQNYKDNNAIIASTEENINNTTTISYDQLIDYIQIKDIYSSENHSTFIYQNHIENNNIVFNSNFQSGNLRMAIKQKENEYDIITRPETNSTRNYQWFFFSVRLNNTTNSSVIKFNIINLVKKTILFNDTVRVLCYYDSAWSRDTFNINYYPNMIPQYNSDSSFYTLTFSFDTSLIVNSANPIVYFSYCYPYTNSHLSLFLSSLSSIYNNILRFENIGKTLRGNAIHMLVITDFTDSFDVLAKKQAVILTGRVHPGESNSSFAVQGVIEYLLSSSNIAVKLRKHFIFKIVPMLNPDGVSIGNFRTNLMGLDLNRMWVDCNEATSPEIYYTKQMVVKTLNSRDVYLFCDFHGHSTKSNFFLYSCKTGVPVSGNPNSTITQNPKNSTLIELIFPHLYNKENFIFDKASCVNKISPSKIKTARAVLKNEFGIDFSYCLESSMASVRLPNGSYTPFTIDLYKNIGKDFCICLAKMINNKIYYAALNVIRNEKKEKKKENCKKSNPKEILPFIHSSLGHSPRVNTMNQKKSTHTSSIITKCGSRNNIYYNKERVNNINIQKKNLCYYLGKQ